LDRIESLKTEVKKEIDALNKLDIGQKARSDTLTEFINESDEPKTKLKLEKKREEALLKYDIERRFHEKKKEELQKLLIEEQNALDRPKPLTIYELVKSKKDYSRIQVVYDVLFNLQGLDKKPVLYEKLKDQLINLLIFGQEDIKKYIERLLKDGIIYEPHPNHYNTV